MVERPGEGASSTEDRFEAYAEPLAGYRLVVPDYDRTHSPYLCDPTLEPNVTRESVDPQGATLCARDEQQRPWKNHSKRSQM